MQSFHGEGGIGTVFSRGTFEGPIVKDKASFLISARRTYADKVVKAIAPSGTEVPGFFFYDLNAKVNYKFSDKDRIFLSGYFGQDRFEANLESDDVKFSVPWGNSTATVRWNHLFGPKLFSNTSLIYNDYEFKFNFEDVEEQTEIDIKTGIQDISGKIDFDYYPTVDHKVKFGGIYIRHEFTPSISQLILSEDSDFLDEPLISNNTVFEVDEGAIYASDEWKVNNSFSVQGGFRVPFFRSDSASYVRIEPRLIGKLSLTQGSSLKASYTMMNQFVHLVTNSGASFPWDIWIPSSDVIKPTRAIQYSMGYFRNFVDNTYEFSVEGYYKEMLNLIEFREGSDILSRVDIEDQVTFGDGTSYGVELFLRKRSGRFNGWLGYTLSKTDRQFEGLNGGRKFPAKYDRRHDLSVVGFYELNKHWSFSAVCVYGTGHSITVPVGEFLGLDQYTDRNAFKLKAYNRFDLGMKYVKKPDAKFQSVFRFDIYNVFNRRNPYFVYVDSFNDPFSNGNENVVKQVSLLPMIPAISWNFKF